MRKNQLWIWLVVLFYLIIGSGYAWYTPSWQNPDEPAHYNYVRQLADGQLPVMEEGDYDQAYQGEVISARFDPEYQLDRGFSYEDYQPPLYYLLQLPVFWLGDGALRPMRLLSLLLGVGIILIGYWIGVLVTGEEWIGLTSAILIAFIPQHLAMLAAVNNDSLTELSIALLLYFLLRWQREPEREVWLWRAAIVLAIGLWTKATVYILLPWLGIWLLYQYWGKWGKVWRYSFILFALPFVLGCFWWGRNLWVYGGWDIMGVGRHGAVVVGQPETADWIATKGIWETGRLFLVTTFHSFWGQFGWMSVPMPNNVYNLLALGTGGLFLTGLSSWYWDRRKGGKQTAVWFLLLGVIVMNLLMYIGYNLSYVQHQGRYLFSSLIPLTLLAAISCTFWQRRLIKYHAQLELIIPFLIMGTLLLLDFWALFRYIIPALSLP